MLARYMDYLVRSMDEHRLKHIIKADINKISPDNLQRVHDFVQTVLNKEKKGDQVIKMKGIWKDTGFEKIVDLEGEIRSLRKETGRQILGKSQRWSHTLQRGKLREP